MRAQAESDDGIYRGLAGGYAGYNYGGQIWGKNTDNWKGAAYTGTVRECAAYRIRSVYGTEYAGGYTGLMRCANVADTGSLNRIMDEMEQKSIIGPYEGAKPRAVLISRQQWLEMQMNQPEE